MERRFVNWIGLSLCTVAVAACTSRTSPLPDAGPTQEGGAAAATAAATRTLPPTTTSAATPSPTTEPSPVPDPPTGWLISGFLIDGQLELEPIFTIDGELPAPSDEGEYQIIVRGSQGVSLFVHHFELGFAVPEGGQEQPLGAFVEVVPYFEAATALDFVGPDGPLHSLSLGGEPPSIRLLEPQPGDRLAGSTRVEWRAEDADSDRLEFILEFSADGGETFAYRSVNVPGPAATIDFDELPGCSSGCLLRVRVSDGVNNARAELREFSVGTKGPEAAITSPRAGMIFQEGHVVSLYSDSRDPDDGYLDGEAVRWTSDRDGLLGTGRQYHAYTLSEGLHTITLTVEDSDGNQASDTVTVQVDGTMPELDLWVVRDAIPSRCVDVTVRASDEEGGSGLREGGISLDGGETWHPLPVEQLPYHFIVPTTGEVHIVVWVEDHAGNVNSDSVPFEISEACPQAEPLPTPQPTES